MYSWVARSCFVGPLDSTQLEMHACFRGEACSTTFSCVRSAQLSKHRPLKICPVCHSKECTSHRAMTFRTQHATLHARGVGFNSGLQTVVKDWRGVPEQPLKVGTCLSASHGNIHSGMWKQVEERAKGDDPSVPEDEARLEPLKSTSACLYIQEGQAP